MKKERAASKPRYPPPEEVRRIVVRHERLLQQLIYAIVIREEDQAESEKQLDALMREHGQAEVMRLWARMQENFNRPEGDEAEAAYLYGIYVRTWQRFGGERPLLAADEFERLRDERAELLGKVMFKNEQLTPEEAERYNELGDLILAEPHLWDDLVPPDPPRTATPGDGPPPPSRRPGRNEPCWCGSGRKYKHYHLHSDEKAGR